MKGNSASAFIIFMIVFAFFFSGFVYFVTQETAVIDETINDGTLGTSVDYSANNTANLNNMESFISNLNSLTSNNDVVIWLLYLFGALVILAILFMVGLISPF